MYRQTLVKTSSNIHDMIQLIDCLTLCQLTDINQEKTVIIMSYFVAFVFQLFLTNEVIQIQQASSLILLHCLWADSVKMNTLGSCDENECSYQKLQNSLLLYQAFISRRKGYYKYCHYKNCCCNVNKLFERVCRSYDITILIVCIYNIQIGV